MRYVTALILALLPVAASAQSIAQPHISVVGTAHRNVVPDQMEWQVEVQTQGAAVPAVAQRHRETVQQVLAFLDAQEIPAQRVRTNRMQLQENWEFRDGDRYRNGFGANTLITFDSPRLDTYDTLWTGLAGIEDVSINNVALTLDDPQVVTNEVKVEALAAAREKALAMAAALDTALGQVLVISETPGNEGPMPMMAARESFKAASDSGGNSISPGEIEVTAEVYVTFALVGL